MSNFAVLRIAKITSLKGLAGASTHNARTASAGLEHADNRTPRMGGGIKLLAGRDDAVEAWHERTKAVGLSRPRKDAVRALEIVMSASPEWFAQVLPEDRRAWCDRSMAWVTQTLGAENILSAHLHDDEETVHIHVLAVPLVQKERKRSGRPRKGRKGSPKKVGLSWGLSAADWVGRPEQLVALQTAYAAEVADLGIRRGRPRRTTGARHHSAAAYRIEAAEKLDAAAELHFQALDELSRAKGTRMFAEIEADEIKADAQRSATNLAQAFAVGLDAIDAGELVYCQNEKNKLPSLARRKVEAPRLPLDRKALQKWRGAVQPFFSCLIKYARRVSSLLEREQAVAHRSEDLAAEAAAIRRIAERQADAEKAIGMTDGPANHDTTILARDRSRQSAQIAVR